MSKASLTTVKCENKKTEEISLEQKGSKAKPPGANYNPLPVRPTTLIGGSINRNRPLPSVEEVRQFCHRHKDRILQKLDSVRIAKIEAFLKEGELEKAREERIEQRVPMTVHQMTPPIPFAGGKNGVMFSSGQPEMDSVYSMYQSPSQGNTSHMVPGSSMQDLSIQIAGPAGLNMYDMDPCDKQTLLSPCSTAVSDGQQPSPLPDKCQPQNFDLNPVLEQSSDIWNILHDLSARDPDNVPSDVDEIRPSFTSGEMGNIPETNDNLDWRKIFTQEQDKSPTLAELNDQNSIFGDTNDHLNSNQQAQAASQLPQCATAQNWAPPVTQSSQVPYFNFARDTHLTTHQTTCTITAPIPSPQTSLQINYNHTQYPTPLPSYPAPMPQQPTAASRPQSLPQSLPHPTPHPLLDSHLGQLLIKPDPDAPPVSNQPAFTALHTTPIVTKTEPVMDDAYGQHLPSKEPRRKRTASGSDDIKKTPVSMWLEAQSSGIKHKRLKTSREEADVAFTPCEEEGPVTREDDTYDSPPEDDDDDSAVDSDFSDVESEGSHSSFIEDFIVTGRKEKRFFWQYNTQSKGPKGKRLCKTISPNDPHVLNDFEDPVFDPDLRDARYKHSGKARRGDGNDITPSPYRLFQIGNQLKRLNRQISDIVPMMEMPQGVRNDKRKEKNKYASKVCRLKKKAQHEANKLKLYGLDQEHAQLMEVLQLLKNDIRARLEQTSHADNEPLCSKLDSYIRTHLVCGMVAGNAADFVNGILEKVANGDKTGGISLMD